MALILIVDDSPTEVFVMQKALEKHGFKTAAAENGEEGIRKAKAMKPDLIFMDIVMPGVNGYQATRMLNNDPETSLIPIIMVTTKGTGDGSGMGTAPGRGGLSRQTGFRTGAGREGTGRAGRMTSTGGADLSLRSLRDRPFELLKELEKRSRIQTAAAAPDAAAGREWVGVACRMGGETFLIAREETREVLGLSGGDHAHSGSEELGEGVGQRAGFFAADVGLAAVPGQRYDQPRGAIHASSW